MLPWAPPVCSRSLSLPNLCPSVSSTMSLDECTSRAEALCARCATTPGMNPFQPIAVSTLELCRAAAAATVKVATHTTRIQKLAVYAVNETERVIDGMAEVPFPLSEDIVRNLERVELKMDEIRRAIEHMPLRSKGKLVKDFTFTREIRCLKGELKVLINALLESTHQFHAVECKGISPIELANLSIRAASAVCEAPVLNFLKPVVGIVEIISETAQTVRSNRQAALQLAAHSTLVTRSIAEHAAAAGMDGSAAPNGESLVALTSALESIHLYLGDLQKPHPRLRRRFASWIMANKEKDRIAEFSQGLDKALALFTTTNVLTTHEGVREIATQVRMNTDILTAIQADVAAVLVTVSSSNLIASEGGESDKKQQNTTALLPFSTAVAQLTFFFVDDLPHGLPSLQGL
ncbi:hypothetical protein C8R45DRAFT_1206837 [Mycena sanguinolenta]|nr:hypothetical protein C8R45DRAFT_1206837 [Mycena sanguinolenta]